MDEFIEIQFLGEKKMEFRMKADQYPEKLRIMEMLAFEEPYVEMDKGCENYFE